MSKKRSKKYRIMNAYGKFFESDVPGAYAGHNSTRKDRRVFGTLTCSVGKLMNKENRVFFHSLEDALSAGFRPCKLCKPMSHD